MPLEQWERSKQVIEQRVYPVINRNRTISICVVVILIAVFCIDFVMKTVSIWEFVSAPLHAKVEDEVPVNEYVIGDWAAPVYIDEVFIQIPEGWVRSFSNEFFLWRNADNTDVQVHTTAYGEWPAPMLYGPEDAVEEFDPNGDMYDLALSLDKLAELYVPKRQVAEWSMTEPGDQVVPVNVYMVSEEDGPISEAEIFKTYGVKSEYTGDYGDGETWTLRVTVVAATVKWIECRVPANLIREYRNACNEIVDNFGLYYVDR